MPIKGLTDRASLKPRLPRLGKLRKGGEKTANKPGPDLDHFRFTSDNPEVVEAFIAAYGDTPRIINCVMFYDTVEENFDSWVEAWDATGMIYRSDKENYLIWRDGDKYSKTPKPHIDTDDQFEVGRLTILVPELIEAGFVGTVTMETHSNNDLRNITSSLYAAEAQGKGLRGTRFLLKRVQESIGTPGFGKTAGKRTRTNKWLVKLELPQQLWTMLDAPDELPQLENGIDTETGEIVDDYDEDDPEMPEAPVASLKLAKMHERWDTRYAEAKALGINVSMIDWSISYDDLKTRGIALAEAIAQRKADLAAAEQE